MYNYSKNKQENLKKLFDYNELLKNTAKQAAKKAMQATDKSVSVAEPSWMSKGAKSSSPFGNGNISSDNFTGLLSSDLPASLKNSANKKPQSSGSLIKQRLSKLLSDSTGKDYSKAFDGIDDRLVEKNIPLANDTVRKNTSKRAYYGNYPNMRDGMALFYAASEANDPKTAKLARQAAYTEEKSRVSNASNDKSSDPSLFFNYGSFPNSFDKDSKGLAYLSNTSNDDNDLQINQHLKSFFETGEFSKDALLSSLGSERYVGVDKALLYRTSKRGSSVLDKIPRGTEVIFTGRKSSHSGVEMAEVVCNGVTGWIKADTLKYSEKVANDKNADKSFVNHVADGAVSLILSSGDSLNRGLDYISFDDHKATENFKSNKKIDLNKTGAMKDEYINDQNKLAEYKFGDKNIQYGGCGIIAMYNVLVGLDHKIDFAQLIYDNEDIALLDAWIGTSPKGVNKALSRYGFDVTEEYDVNEKTDVSDCDAVIHLYFRDDVSAHYVAGIPNSKGQFRFYNDDIDETLPLYWNEYFAKVSDGTWYSMIFKIKKRSE